MQLFNQSLLMKIAKKMTPKPQGYRKDPAPSRQGQIYDITLNDGAQDVPDKVMRIEPFDPILIITHLVRNPLLSNSCPANIGLLIPVNDSA